MIDTLFNNYAADFFWNAESKEPSILKLIKAVENKGRGSNQASPSTGRAVVMGSGRDVDSRAVKMVLQAVFEKYPNR